MKSTLIRFPEDEYELYKEIAREKGWSLAEFLRDSARKNSGIRAKKNELKKYSFWNLGRTFVIKGGPRDASVNADKYYFEFEEVKMRRSLKRKKKT